MTSIQEMPRSLNKRLVTTPRDIFLESWHSNNKKPSLGEVWIFSGTTHCTYSGINFFLTSRGKENWFENAELGLTTNQNQNLQLLEGK